MEASFCGSDVGVDQGFHYTRQHLENMGQMFGRTLYDYFYVETPPQNEIQIAQAAEPKVSSLDNRSGFKSKNALVSGIFSKIKQEISSGNPEFIESYGSSDSDTSSDEEALRIKQNRKPKRRSKSHSSKSDPKPLKSSSPENSPESVSKDILHRKTSASLKNGLNRKLSRSYSRTAPFPAAADLVIYTLLNYRKLLLDNRQM